MNNLVSKLKLITDKFIKCVQNFRWQEISIIRKILLVLGLIVVLIFPLSAFVAHNIDDNISYNSEKTGVNLVINDMISLIDREVVENGWIANKPFFFPQALFLDNMPNFQQGIIYGIHAVAKALAKTTTNPQIEQAALALSTSGTKWGFGKNNAARQYIEARNLLQENASFVEMNKETYLSIIDEANHALITRFRETSDFIESTSLFKTDNQFYFNRGAIYSLYILIRDSLKELSQTEEDNYIQAQSKKLLGLMQKALEYEPFVIFSFSDTPTIVSNHILVQNYYVGQISLIMKDIVNRR